MSKEAVNFLNRVYSNSLGDMANIYVAEAEGNSDVILSYLHSVKDFVERLIKEVTTNTTEREK